MTRSTFYRGGAALPVHGRGQEPGQQRIAAVRRLVKRTCAEIGCAQHELGWTIQVDLSSPEDANVARFIREGKTRRRYAEVELVPGAVEFRFAAGQPCLSSPHQVESWEEPAYFVGDRQTVREEWHTRFEEGGDALIAVTTRLREME